MAKYTVPLSFPRIVGSKQGSTFQKSGKVYSIRKHNAPTNKKRVKQTQQRGTFGAIASKFRSLSSTNKQSFTDQAPNFPRTNSLGVVYTLQAHTLQNSTNINSSNADQPLINTMQPPVVFPVSLNPSAIIQPFANAALIAFSSPLFVPAGFVLQQWAAAPAAPGRYVSSVSFRLVRSLNPGDNITANIFNALLATFGNSIVVIGNEFWAKLQWISITNGQKSTPYNTLGTIQP